jgi:redox-sensing transcriptional repressor
MQDEGDDYISGTLIARELNLEPIQVRKDMAITGIIGKPKQGCLIEYLISVIERFLRRDSVQDAALAGAGNLGTALLGYREFQLHGLCIRAVFDKSPEKTGAAIHGVKVFPVDTMETQIRGLGIETSILTVPSPSAQETADILIRAGVEGVWNFTNVKLKVPQNGGGSRRRPLLRVRHALRNDAGPDHGRR